MNERDIFIEARRIEDPDKRVAFVREACGTDDSCRAKVENLLEVFARAGSFLEPNTPGTAPTLGFAPVSAMEKPGTMIDRYKLVHEIGHGGMGVVYMAVQKEPVKRKVALKIIKPGMDTREVVARFNTERQALAMMDHPNIAKVWTAAVRNPGGRSSSWNW